MELLMFSVWLLPEAILMPRRGTTFLLWLRHMRIVCARAIALKSMWLCTMIRIAQVTQANANGYIGGGIAKAQPAGHPRALPRQDGFLDATAARKP